jgi:precorrin-6A/cobalt-precorrin-6A reductase
MRILILGGTREARELACKLSANRRFAVVLSLAGRTSAPMDQGVETRVGGFGGAEGLARYLNETATAAVIDATHPFADQISANAVAAARAAGVPLASLHRAPWDQQVHDRWVLVPDAAAAASAIGVEAKRVLLTVGRLELSAFAAAPQHHYTARTIDPPGEIALPPNIQFIRARPPFDVSSEEALLRAEGIDVLVSKNSGGPDTYGKIEAARRLDLPVIMIARPYKAAGHLLASEKDVLAWLDVLHPCRSERGV